MSNFLSLLWTPLGVIVLAVVLDAISEDVRTMLDRLPLFLVKVSVRLLPPELRESAAREYRGDLDQALHHTDGLRLLRLIKGMAFALSLWLRISEVRREAGYPADRLSRRQRVVTAIGVVMMTVGSMTLLTIGAYSIYLAGNLTLSVAAMYVSIGALEIGWAIGVLKPRCAGSQSMLCLGFGGTGVATLLTADLTQAAPDVWLMGTAAVALMASGFVRDFGSRSVRPFGLLGQAAVPFVAAASWVRGVFQADTLSQLCWCLLAAAVFSSVVIYFVRRMQEELFETRYATRKASRVK